jgi:hypothetical protein
MKFLAYLLWTISAPFFAGGVVWAVMAAFIPLWAVALSMFVHLGIWATVQEKLNEAGWDN